MLYVVVVRGCEVFAGVALFTTLLLLFLVSAVRDIPLRLAIVGVFGLHINIQTVLTFQDILLIVVVCMYFYVYV